MIERSDIENQFPETKHFVLLAMVPAFAVSVPYAYLLWHEAVHYDYPFWGWDLFVLLGAPFVGYGLAGLILWAVRARIGSRPIVYSLGIAVIGSFAALTLAFLYFLTFGQGHPSWRVIAYNAFFYGAALSGHALVFIGTCLYTVVRLRKAEGILPSVTKT